MRPLRVLTAVAGVLVVACLLACGAIRQGIKKGVEAAKSVNSLKQIGLLYHTYHNQKGKGPAGVDELKQVATTADERAAVDEAGPGGTLVVIWGASIISPKDGPGSSNIVLGYEKNVPTSGGAVLMLDGTVKSMTAQEFNAATKATAAAGPKKK
jgi:hypothetical protein